MNEHDDDDEDRPGRRQRPRREYEDDVEKDRDESHDPDDEDGVPRRRRRRRRPARRIVPEMEFIIPMNTSALAIIAGYVGLISVLCIPAPIALILGILAMVQLNRNPDMHGRYRAVFAIVMGALFTIPLIVLIGALIKQNL